MPRRELKRKKARQIESQRRLSCCINSGTFVLSWHSAVSSPCIAPTSGTVPTLKPLNDNFDIAEPGPKPKVVLHFQDQPRSEAKQPQEWLMGVLMLGIFFIADSYTSTIQEGLYQEKCHCKPWGCLRKEEDLHCGLFPESVRRRG